LFVIFIGSLFRSTGKICFSEHKYTALGVKPERAKHGVSDYSHQAKAMPQGDWDNLVHHGILLEKLMRGYIPTIHIRRVNEAQSMVGFKTMRTMTQTNGLNSTKIFGSVAYGLNVHLPVHLDDDFTWGIVTPIKIDHDYSYRNDDIVVYFCFPRLGMAVALWHGDVLIFDPMEPHAVSSRCQESDDIYILSYYLKTAVVGLNDNRLELTSEQIDACDFNSAHRKMQLKRGG